MEREKKESKEIARAVLLPLLRLKALSNNPQLQKTQRAKQGHLKQPFPSLIPTPAALPLPPQVLMVLPSLLYLQTAQVASPCYSTLLRQHDVKQQQEKQQEQPPCSRSQCPTSRACRSSAGRCSAAPWGGRAELRDLERSPLTGERFSLRCSTASAGMCKQTVCRPINHSPPGRFS